MSELLENAAARKAILKEMILKLHQGDTADAVRSRLIQTLGSVPYAEVVEVEQELMNEGLPREEILKLCDLHSQAMKGALDLSSAKPIPPGHPVHTFIEENRALSWEIGEAEKVAATLSTLDDGSEASDLMMSLRRHLHALTDVDKHYRRKENLLFPYLESRGIEGPTVMWGKDDEIRSLMKDALAVFETTDTFTVGEAKIVFESLFSPLFSAISEMIYKEEHILFPMCMDTLNDSEWMAIADQSLEIGFCLYDPTIQWKPEGVTLKEKEQTGEPADRVRLPSGSMTPGELTAILNTIPFDLTFVDAEDTVRYFTQGRERIFDRNRAILGRKVQLCHPPSSVHIVERILSDFKAGREDQASFWIELKGKFIMIQYFALRDEPGNYLGTLEVSQDLTSRRALTGERRLLKYGDPEGSSL